MIKYPGVKSVICGEVSQQSKYVCLCMYIIELHLLYKPIFYLCVKVFVLDQTCLETL